jgi:hypothetical protein
MRKDQSKREPKTSYGGMVENKFIASSSLGDLGGGGKDDLI